MYMTHLVFSFWIFNKRKRWKNSWAVF